MCMRGNLLIRVTALSRNPCPPIACLEQLRNWLLIDPAAWCNGSVAKRNRLTLASPRAGLCLENTCRRDTARTTAPDCIQSPSGQLVPIAANQQGAATVAIRTAAGVVMHVASVDVAQPMAHRGRPRAGQRLGRRRRMVAHAPVGME